VDLHPPGFLSSAAQAVLDGQQVGYARMHDVSEVPHAMLWSSSAGSAIDLNPHASEGSGSVAKTLTENSQAGYGWSQETDWDDHALLWHGSAESALDLNPIGFKRSTVNASAGDVQVGWGVLADSHEEPRALLWHGSADSVADLHQFVPPEFRGSEAFAVDERGVVFGSAYTTAGSHAVMWVPTTTAAVDLPAPLAAGAVLLVLAVIMRP
jgi:hypothetical protein